MQAMGPKRIREEIEKAQDLLEQLRLNLEKDRVETKASLAAANSEARAILGGLSITAGFLGMTLLSFSKPVQHFSEKLTRTSDGLLLGSWLATITAATITALSSIIYSFESQLYKTDISPEQKAILTANIDKTTSQLTSLYGFLDKIEKEEIKASEQAHTSGEDK